MKRDTITPAKLRFLMTGVIFIILATAIGLFYVSYQHLSSTANDVSKTLSAADDTEAGLQTIQATREKLILLKQAINKADAITGDNKDYAYQDQIIKDMFIYANRAGVKITNINFGGATSGGDSAQNAPAESTAPSPASPSTGSSPVSGAQSTNIVVTLNNPVNYKNLLNFFHMIEESLPKLQISKVNLTKGDGGTSVTTDALSIELYVK